jgi:hypothetical protein
MLDRSELSNDKTTNGNARVLERITDDFYGTFLDEAIDYFEMAGCEKYLHFCIKKGKLYLVTCSEGGYKTDSEIFKIIKSDKSKKISKYEQVRAMPYPYVRSFGESALLMYQIVGIYNISDDPSTKRIKGAKMFLYTEKGDSLEIFGVQKYMIRELKSKSEKLLNHRR